MSKAENATPGSAGRSEPSRTWRVEGALVLALVAYWMTITLDRYQLSHDTALLLDVGGRLMRGQMPYVDYVETNPPLSHYLNVIPNALAWAFGGEPLTWLRFCLVALLAFSVTWLRARLPPLVSPFKAGIVGLTFIAFAFFVYEGKNLGQREHLFVMLAVPYIVTRLRRTEAPERRDLAVLSGVLAAIGVCIKPHFLLVLGGIELAMALWLRRRWLGPEVIACAATGLLYPLHFLFLPHEMRYAFFELWLPALVDGYKVVGQNPELVWRNTVLAFQDLLKASFLVFVFLDGRARRIALVLGAGALAGFVIFVLQGKGWTYHRIPSQGFLVLAVGLAFGEILTRFPRGELLAVFYAAWLFIPVHDMREGRGLRGPNSSITRVVEHTAPGDKVLYISTNAYQAYPGLLLEGRKHVGTYPIAFPLGVLYPDGAPNGYRAPKDRPEAERRFVRSLFGDLAKKPKVIAIESRRTCDHCAPGVNYPAYLESIAFNKRLRKDYEKKGKASHCDIWVRKSKPGEKKWKLDVTDPTLPGPKPMPAPEEEDGGDPAAAPEQPGGTLDE